MTITIDHFKQVCEAMASNAKSYKVESNDEKIKFYQRLLATLPPDVKKTKSWNSIFHKKVKEEKSERRQCLDKLDQLYSGKIIISTRIRSLEQLKLEADRFVESEINMHAENKDEKTGKDMRAYEPISPDQLMHAHAILCQFLSNISTECVGASAGIQLRGKIEHEVRKLENKPARRRL